ncbi:MAG: hypothetical protein JWP87_6308 [Labilithrix sp.]|nr:hypothetical protein [Labilithrix sp.]
MPDCAPSAEAESSAAAHRLRAVANACAAATTRMFLSSESATGRAFADQTLMTSVAREKALVVEVAS